MVHRMKISLLLLATLTAAAPAAPDCTIVVSAATAADPGWGKVVEKLKAKHSAAVVTWKDGVKEALPALQMAHPRFTCFVATPAEAGRAFVQEVNRLTRRYDADVYTDTRWGILTGHDAENALAIASEEKPLTIHNVGSGTELALDRCETGTWYCELNQGKVVRRDKDGKISQGEAPPDTTKALVDLMNEGKPDLWITSGHATERDWMLGFRYQNGFWKSKDGRLFGEDTKKAVFDVQSPNPKVYLAVGNCLMGHIDGPDAMALAWMKSAGVRQMTGYVLPTWYGYQGWGMLDYYVEQPGRYTLPEAFVANNIALVHRLETFFPGAMQVQQVSEMGRPLKGEPRVQPGAEAKAAGLGAQDLAGLLFDRDNVACYGDPAWEARMAPGKLNWEQTLAAADGTFTFTVKPLAGADTFKPVNQNGSQRGGRPIVQFLPQRIDPATVKITSGAELKPVITDDFILVPVPSGDTTPGTLTVNFMAATR